MENLKKLFVQLDNYTHPLENTQQSWWGVGASQVAQWWRIHLPMQESQVLSLGREDPLEKEMSTHSSILAWEIPWTEEPGGLQSMGLQKVRHDWAHTHQSSECIHIHWVKDAHRNILRKIGSNVIFSILWKEAQKKLMEETCSRSQNPAKAETRHEFRSPTQYPSLPTISPWLYPWGGRAFVLTHFPFFCFRSLLLLLLNVFLLKYNCYTQSLLFLIKILQYSNPYLDPIILSPSPEITTLLNSEFVIPTYIW